MDKTFDVRRLYIVVPTELFERIKENHLFRALDNVLVEFLIDYCDRAERGELDDDRRPY